MPFPVKPIPKKFTHTFFLNFGLFNQDINKKGLLLFLVHAFLKVWLFIKFLKSFSRSLQLFWPQPIPPQYLSREGRHLNKQARKTYTMLSNRLGVFPNKMRCYRLTGALLVKWGKQLLLHYSFTGSLGLCNLALPPEKVILSPCKLLVPNPAIPKLLCQQVFMVRER